MVIVEKKITNEYMQYSIASEKLKRTNTWLVIMWTLRDIITVSFSLHYN